MLFRLFYIALLGLIGALIVHLTILLLVPRVSTSTAWNTVSETFEPAIARELVVSDETTQGVLLPYERALICRYELANGILEITAPKTSQIWSISVHDPEGRILFSANDRNIVHTGLNLTVVNNSQLRTLRQQGFAEGIEEPLIVNARNDQGFVMIRALELDESWRPITDAFFEAIECTQAPI